MKSIKCQLKDFEFERFVKDIMRFCRKIADSSVHPSVCVTKVEKPGGVPKFGPEKGRDTFRKELEAGLWLFFPFCGPNVGKPVPCADGKSRKIDGDDDFCLGDTDTAGYLVGLKKDKLIIYSSIQSLSCMPTASVNVVKNCGLLEKPMARFIQSFHHPLRLRRRGRQK